MTDHQTSVRVRVFEGESAHVSGNIVCRISDNFLVGQILTSASSKFIGELVLPDLNPSDAGVPRIEVTLSIDEQGIISVRATDKASINSVLLELNDEGRASRG